MIHHNHPQIILYGCKIPLCVIGRPISFKDVMKLHLDPPYHYGLQCKSLNRLNRINNFFSYKQTCIYIHTYISIYIYKYMRVNMYTYTRLYTKLGDTNNSFRKKMCTYYEGKW